MSDERYPDGHTEETFPNRVFWVIVVTAIIGLGSFFFSVFEAQASRVSATQTLEQNRQLLQDVAELEQQNGVSVKEHREALQQHRERNEALHRCIPELVVYLHTTKNPDPARAKEICPKALEDGELDG